jgi:hypothetical protein
MHLRRRDAVRLQLCQDFRLGQVEAERFQRNFQLVVVDVVVAVEVEQAERFVDLFARFVAQAVEELLRGGFAALALEALLSLCFEAGGFALLVRLLRLGLRLGLELLAPP